MDTMIQFLLALVFASTTLALDNGVALTPPMGWLSWAKFFCETDCVKHPLSCISERLYMDMADMIVSEGYKDVGYEYVNVDDCWMSKERDAQGRLVADPIRFPHGIKYLADYMHKRGLKLGIYEDYGTKTCGGYPGSLGHLKTDADTFAEWGVDSLKLDGCNVDVSKMDSGYPNMTKALNETHRPIIYSCSWPAYEVGEKIQPDYLRIAKYCNLWRNYNDISISWDSIQSIITYYDHHQNQLIPAAGPGHWNDPDMIVVGNLQLTVDQSKTQMAIWCIWAAPLLMSNDLRFVAPAYKKILQNKKVIAINQDPLGKMGRLIVNTTNVGVYSKDVLPMAKSEYSKGVVFFNRNRLEKAFVAVRLDNIGLTNPGGYMVEDLFDGTQHGHMNPNDTFSGVVNPMGVIMLKATIDGTSPLTNKTPKQLELHQILV